MNAKKAKSRQTLARRLGPVFVLGIIIISSSSTLAAFGMTSSGPYPDTEDVIFVWSNTALVTDYVIGMDSWRDLNADGDFADVGDRTTFVNLVAVVNCAGGNGHVSCDLQTGTDGIATIVFRNVTSQHVAGNYTLSVRSRNALGNTIDNWVYSFRIVSRNWVNTTDLPRTDYLSSRVNATNCVENHCTDYISQRINETACTVNHCTDYISQRINETNCLGNHCTDYISSRINLTNCLDNPCEANATVNLTSFTSDCHGTGQNFCINGHTPNTLNDNLLRFAVAFVVLAGLTFMAIQRSFIVPLMAFFGSLAFMFFLFAVGDFFTLENNAFTTIVYQVFKMTPIIPFAIGGFNAGIGFATARKGGEPT